VEGGGPTNYQGFSSSTLKREARSGTAAAAGTWELGIIRLRGLVQAEISQARVSAVVDAGSASGPSPSEAACASHARAARP